MRQFKNIKDGYIVFISDENDKLIKKYEADANYEEYFNLGEW